MKRPISALKETLQVNMTNFSRTLKIFQDRGGCPGAHRAHGRCHTDGSPGGPKSSESRLREEHVTRQTHF